MKYIAANIVNRQVWPSKLTMCMTYLHYLTDVSKLATRACPFCYFCHLFNVGYPFYVIIHFSFFPILFVVLILFCS